MVLERDFLELPADAVARALLGAELCRRHPDGSLSRWPITEVEAYVGPEDRACHAHRGRTKRTAPLFGPAGHWYIYLCYGVHWLANLVTGPVDHPAAVLLRGAGPWAGPGRLTRALEVDGSLNQAVIGEAAGFWVETGATVPDGEVARTPRIGVDYAGPEWAAQPLRFVWTPQWSGRTGKRS